ncbi:MAG TPA: hypothetical protein VEV38_10405 [Candidatus Eremiobacteraceae bacterium]|nr:hypothetical protein [Candidatus Eremiobacteraceae bacterium]
MKLFIAALAAVTVSCIGSSVSAKSDSLSIKLVAQNGSKQTGWALLTAMGSKTKVVLSVSHTKGSEPAHIHPGTCANLNPVPKIPLSDVVNGKSTTVIDATLASLETGHFAINVHAGPGPLIKKYVSCGNIPASGGSSM